MKIERLLAIVVLLLNKNRISAVELAEKFGVSVRTIYRDIETINSAGIPIISFPGNNGGFGILDTYKFDKHCISEADMNYLLSTIKGINTTMNDVRLETIIAKLLNLSKRKVQTNNDESEEYYIIDMQPYGFINKQKETIKHIHKALANHNVIEVEYVNSKSEISTRLLEPMTLVFKAYVWYLFAYCRQKDDFRFFKLSRIKNLKFMENLVFERRDYKYSDFEKRNEYTTELTKIVLRFSERLKSRIEDYFPEESITYNIDGTLDITREWVEDEWVYSYIMSFGDDVQVIAPSHIKEKIIEKAENILKRFQS